MITGYKWTERKSDGKLFIVTLQCNNEFTDPDEGHIDGKITFYADGKSFYTTDCIVERIEDEDGNTVESVDGHAFASFVYYVGQVIKGQRIYYMHDREYLITYAGKKWNPATRRLTAILTAWIDAGTQAEKMPFFFFLSADERHRMQENVFLQNGGTLEDLHILDMERRIE